MEEKPDKDGVVFLSRFNGDWVKATQGLLSICGLKEAIGRSNKRKVLLKPNLVEAIQPPVTTPVGLIEAIVGWLADSLPDIEVIVGDGTGAADYATKRCFDELGYTKMAKRRHITLVDLNLEELIKLENPACKRWPQMHLPRIVMDSFLVSIPVLKAHSLAVVTLTMKNLMGCAPAALYQKGGHWKKASFHDGMQEAILDLNRYRKPDFCILDATVGMSEAHLWGAHCDPPPGIIAAGADPVMMDAFGAGLLDRDWREIGHIKNAHKELGFAEPVEVREVG